MILFRQHKRQVQTLSNKKTSAIVTEEITVEYDIGNKPRKGLFTYHRKIPRENSFDGWIEAMRERCAADEAEDPADPKQRVSDRLESMEKNINGIKQTEAVDSKTPEVWTVASHADSALKKIDWLKDDIKKFDKECNSSALSSIFYEAILSALVLTASVEKFTTKRHEKNILRGRESSFNHKGAPAKEQRQAVERVDALTTKGANKPDAVKQVAAENGVTPQAVYGWIKKVNSGVVVTKTVVQDSD